jgi:predicted dehydrogenase
MKKLKAGIVGVGRIGRVQIRAIRSLGCEISAILSRDQGRAAALAAELRAERGAECDTERGAECGIKPYSDLAAFLADPDVDVVHVCTPNLQHYAVARACLLAGKPVLCEKPLTADPSQSAELAALAAEREIPTAVNFVYRHYPTLARLKAMLDAGDLGTIYAIRGGFLQGQMLSELDWDWRVDSSQGGQSRAMADIGSHWCDLVTYLLGQKIAEVCADFATFLPERIVPATREPASESRRFRVDTEDYASSLLHFSSGARGSFSVSQTTAGSKSVVSVEIDGSLASARWERERADILRLGRRDSGYEELRQGEDPSPDWEAFRTEAQRGLVASFYAQILEGVRGSHADFADGHRMVQVVAAMVESGRAHAWVGIPESPLIQ